jgi:hypothetical protein
MDLASRRLSLSRWADALTRLNLQPLGNVQPFLIADDTPVFVDAEAGD